MSQNESPENESGQLTAEDLAGIKRKRESATKTRHFEFEQGTASFVIEMVKEGTLTELSQQHVEQKVDRKGADISMDADGYENFRAAVVKEGVTDGPPGYKATLTHIKQTYPEEVLEELFECITEFSEISEEETLKFR
jgi:hypothetical protein